MKKLSKTWTLTLILLFPFLTYGQNQISENLSSLIGTPLESAQGQLQSMGFEIASSSLLKKNQLWYNESENVCITILFNKKGEKLIESIEPGDEAACKAGVEAARKVWENYHNGQSNENSSKIEAERKELRQQGYVASYWINEVSPGKIMEVWANDSKQLSKSIIWDKATKSDVKVIDREFKYAKNPSPIKN